MVLHPIDLTKKTSENELQGKPISIWSQLIALQSIDWLHAKVGRIIGTKTKRSGLLGDLSFETVLKALLKCCKYDEDIYIFFDGFFRLVLCFFCGRNQCFCAVSCDSRWTRHSTTLNSVLTRRAVELLFLGPGGGPLRPFLSARFVSVYPCRHLSSSESALSKLDRCVPIAI